MLEEFDARAAALLQPGARMLLRRHPGLQLVASETKRSWIYHYRSPVDRAMRQTKIGEWPKVSYGAAFAKWEQLRQDRAAGADVQLQKRAARRELQRQQEAADAPVYTVAVLVDDYLTGHIDLHRKPKGRQEVRRILTGNTKQIAEKPAAQLMRSEAYDLLQGLSDRPVLMHQVRQEMAAAYDFGLDSGRLPENTTNWWREVFRGKMPRSKGKRIAGEYTGGAKRVLNEREVGLLINWLPKASVTLQDALTLYLWTGTRGAEIVTMQFGEVQDEAGVLWWTIPKEKTKNARHAAASDLRVPLIGRARAIVLRRRADVQDRPETLGFLFPSKGGKLPHIEQKTIQSSLYAHQPYATSRAKDRAVLPVSRWSPHDLRRTVRTLLASMGCPGDVAESVLGHMQGGIVGVYNRHTYDAERREWLTKLDARLEHLALACAAS